MEPYAVNHGPLLTVTNCVETPKAPPRRKRPQRKLDKEMQPLRRSLSFTDAHFIAQAVYEGDSKLIEELYPDFPRYVLQKMSMYILCTYSTGYDTSVITSLVCIQF